jgi:type I restriction enzyme S subunit
VTASVANRRWDDRALLDLVTIKSGQVDPRVAPYRDLPLIAPDHLAPQTGRLLKKESAVAQGAISGKYLVRPGDVIYSKIRPYLQKAYRCDFDALCSADMYPLTPRDGVDPSFVLHSILGRDFTNFAVSVSVRSGIPKINREELAEYRLRAPSEAEQRAIGQALDEADDLIAGLERLIAKKQAIKRGMMQQLLTGRTRLPGSFEDWRLVRLGDHVTYVKTVALSRAQLDGTSSLRYLHYGDIHKGSAVLLDASAESMPRVGSRLASRAGPLRVGDLVFADASEDPDGVGKSVEISGIPEDGVVAGLHTIAARFDKAVLADGFKAYVQFIPAFRESLLRLAAGTKVLATTRTGISSVTLTLPCVAEQVAIATVLRHADAEIEALAARLEKARAVKRGMMQQLLTGRARLPVEVTG